MGYHHGMKRIFPLSLASLLIVWVSFFGGVQMGYAACTDAVGWNDTSCDNPNNQSSAPNSVADSRNGSDVQSDSAAAASAAKTDLKSPNFKFNANDISPSTNKGYTKGTGNIKDMTQRITNWLLVIVSTGAVLFIIVGGLFMATSAGDEDRSTKGKTIVMYNIQALVIAMFSYGIIQFIIWVLSPAS